MNSQQRKADCLWKALELLHHVKMLNQQSPPPNTDEYKRALYDVNSTVRSLTGQSIEVLEKDTTIAKAPEPSYRRDIQTLLGQIELWLEHYEVTSENQEERAYCMQQIKDHVDMILEIQKLGGGS